MPQVDGHDRESKEERGGTDQQVGEWNNDAFGFLLAVDPPSEQCGPVGVGIYRKSGAQLVNELLTVDTALFRIRSVDSMYEFSQTNCGEGNLLVTGQSSDLGRQLRGVSPPRSAAITTLESRISPMQADQAVRGDY